MSFSHNIHALATLVQQTRLPTDSTDEKENPEDHEKPAALRMLSLSPNEKSERLIRLFYNGKALAKVIPSSREKRFDLYEQLYDYKYHPEATQNEKITSENFKTGISRGYHHTHGMEAIAIAKNSQTRLHTPTDPKALPVALIFDTDMCPKQDLYALIASPEPHLENKVEALSIALHEDKSDELVVVRLSAIDPENHSIALQGIAFGENTPAMRAFAREIHIEIILALGEKFNALPLVFYDAEKNHVEVYSNEQRKKDMQDCRTAERNKIKKIKTDLETQLHPFGCGFFLHNKIRLVHGNDTQVLSRGAALSVIAEIKIAIAEDLSLQEVESGIVDPLFKNTTSRPKIRN